MWVVLDHAVRKELCQGGSCGFNCETSLCCEVSFDKFEDWEYGPKGSVGIASESMPGIFIHDSKGALYKVSEPKACKNITPDRYLQFDKDEGLAALIKNDVIFEENLKEIPDGKINLKGKNFTLVTLPPIFDQ